MRHLSAKKIATFAKALAPGNRLWHNIRIAMKTILFFQTGTPEIVRLKFAGVMDYARDKNWDVKTVDMAGGSRFVRDSIRFWKAAGCIAEASGGAKGLSPSAFGSTPVVYLCHDPKKIKNKAACVTSDSPAVAKLVADELVALGRKSIAFVDWFDPSAYWCETKREVFIRELDAHGLKCEVFTPRPGDAADRMSLQRGLREWIAGLPKPCSVFAVADVIGEQVLAACRALGAAVPEEVAVIAVNDDEQICDAAVPPLSSIRLDYRRTGRLAASLLDRAMGGEKVRGHFTVPPDGVARRTSTRLFKRADGEARAALEAVRRRACDGLRPSEVLGMFSCSRRLAEMRFKAAAGRTITEEIQAVRMERVYMLLARADVPIGVIASRCGWPSESFLRRHFRRVAGMSLREWRQRHALTP